MKLITAILSLLLVASIAGSEQRLRTISWDKTKPAAGEVIPPSGEASFDQLKIANMEAKPLTVTLIAIEDLGITDVTYAIAGQIRYENVEGKGYLEMWSVFPDGSRFFTRTLGVGPLWPIEGTSGWRYFILPFNAQGAKDKPAKLIINLVLPGKGTVYIGPLKLVQSPDLLARVKTPWWNDPRFFWLGPATGIYSVLVGLFAGITVWLVLRGKARKFVTVAWYAFLGVGIGFLIVSRIAQMQGQPGDVHLPLLLTGIIHTVLAALAINWIRKYYERWELRKMTAQDAGGR